MTDKVLLVSSDGERITQLPRTFETPMGLALDGPRMAVATRNGITLLAIVVVATCLWPGTSSAVKAVVVIGGLLGGGKK